MPFRARAHQRCKPTSDSVTLNLPSSCLMMSKSTCLAIMAEHQIVSLKCGSSLSAFGVQLAVFYLRYVFSKNQKIVDGLGNKYSVG